MLALGYAGWAPGQLETEIQANGWLHCRATPELIFDPNLDGKYDRALASIGIDSTRLSGEAGTPERRSLPRRHAVRRDTPRHSEGHEHAERGRGRGRTR